MVALDSNFDYSKINNPYVYVLKDRGYGTICDSIVGFRRIGK